jgi:hypothetical protein
MLRKLVGVPSKSVVPMKTTEEEVIAYFIRVEGYARQVTRKKQEANALLLACLTF